jgi:hypothetical protein
MALNGISTLATKEAKQKAKLDLASTDRLADNNPRGYYDITEMPTTYSGNDVVDNLNIGGLVEGRPWISTSPNISIVNSGPSDENNATITFTVYSNRVYADGTTLYYTIDGTGITTNDFAPGTALTGSFTFANGEWTTNLQTVSDRITEGFETLTLTIWLESGHTTNLGSSSVTIGDTSVGPTYAFGTIPSSIDEGSAGTFTVVTTNISRIGTTLYWTIETNLSDFGTTSGSFIITNNTGSFTVTPTADSTTEGSETFTVALRTGSVTGPIVATSNTVSINDTSTLTPLANPVELSTNSDFTNGTTGWTASGGGFAPYSYNSSDKVALYNGELYFTYILRTVSQTINVSSVIANAASFKATVNIRHREKNDAATYTQVDTYTFTVVFKNSSGATVTTKTTGLSNAPQTATAIDLTLNRSEIPSTFGTITSAVVSVSGIDTGYWNGNWGPIVKYIRLIAS